MSVTCPESQNQLATDSQRWCSSLTDTPVLFPLQSETWAEGKVFPWGQPITKHIKPIKWSRDITLPTKVRLVKAMVFPVVMYGFESWIIKKAEHQRNDAFELWCWRRLESPLDCKEIQPVNPKGDQSWIFTGRTDAETETPVLWPPDAKNWLTGKDPDAGKDWRQEEKGITDSWKASPTRWRWA